MNTVAFGLRAQLAARLERGAFGWGALPFPAQRRITRPLARHAAYAHALIVTVGGATLGGSHKTPLVRALAKALCARGVRVAVAAHGYRASLDSDDAAAAGGGGEARYVNAHEHLSVVGDDALYLARALPEHTVVIGHSRAAAVAFAARAADVILVDGCLALSPRTADVRVLTLDAREPWGAGDRIASPAALQAAATHTVHVDELATTGTLALATRLQTQRVGVLTTIARPGRFLRTLAAHGVHPVVHARFGDHGPIRARDARSLAALGAEHGVGAWVTTEKCILHALAHVHAIAASGAQLHAWETHVYVPSALVHASLGRTGEERVVHDRA